MKIHVTWTLPVEPSSIPGKTDTLYDIKVISNQITDLQQNPVIAYARFYKLRPPNQVTQKTESVLGVFTPTAVVSIFFFFFFGRSTLRSTTSNQPMLFSLALLMPWLLNINQKKTKYLVALDIVDIIWKFV